MEISQIKGIWTIPLYYAHQGVASAVRSGSKDSTKNTTKFDNRIKNLQAFKEEHGHCNVTLSKSDKKSHNSKYQSLASWCCNIRYSYRKIKQGGKPSYKLSDANIQLLDRMGFEWGYLRIYEERKSFDDRIKDLQAFKEEHGHCLVPTSKSEKNKYKSLGSWCSQIRHKYKKTKQGQTKSSCNLHSVSDAKIQRLDAVGFKWNLHEKK